MKKLIIILILIIAGIAAFVIVGFIDSGDDLSDPPETGNEKIYIGVFEPLSGFNSAGGEQELLGLEYAQSVCPTVSVGGKPYDLAFIVEDNKSEAQFAISAAERLVKKEICAVIGSFGSAMSAEGGTVFAREKIPAISASSSSLAVTEGNEYYYSICFSDSFQGGVLASFARGLGLEKVAVAIQAGDTYSRGISRYFGEEFKRLGGETEEFSFNSVQQNFEPLIEEIRGSGADGVFMPSYGSSAAVFIKQARQHGISLPIFGGDTWDTYALISEIAPYKSDIYFSSPYDPDTPDDPAASGFAAKFRSWVAKDEERLERNGGTSYPAPCAALAYDAYMILAKAIESCDSADPEDIALYLKTMSYSGVTGSFTFDEQGNSGKTVAYIKTINDKADGYEVLRTYSSKG